MAESQQLTVLRKKFGNKCHYCGELCNSHRSSPKKGTREHVVPRAFGGANSLSNYVLACQRCNNNRGNQLFFCGCDFCAPLIRAALQSKAFINKLFKNIIEHNTHRVYRDNEGRWCTQIYHGRKHHESWRAAMDYALNYEHEGAR